MGKDTDGDGDCPVCVRWDAGDDIIPAIMAAFVRTGKAKKITTTTGTLVPWERYDWTERSEFRWVKEEEKRDA
jgi:hypothetical protein